MQSQMLLVWCSSFLLSFPPVQCKEKITLFLDADIQLESLVFHHSFPKIHDVITEDVNCFNDNERLAVISSSC